MRNLFVILFVVFSQSLCAQLMRIEFGVGFLINTQSGTIFTKSDVHNPAWYDEVDVDRRLWQPTASMQLYYPINFGTLSFQRFSFGVQTGISLGKSSLSRSYDQTYVQQNFTAYRIPVMGMVKTGSCNSLYGKKAGLSFGGGIEITSLSFADEYGKFIMPVIQIGFGIKRSVTSINIFPSEITSTYRNNGKDSKRLTNKLFEFRFALAIECVPKRYRSTRGMDLYKFRLRDR